MTCNTCNECNPCEKENTPCCELKVLAGDCVDVEEVNWAYVVSATCPPRVVPWEGVTVDIYDSPEEWYSVDYEVNAIDNKVGACEADWHPGSLEEKLRVVDGWPITRRVVWCWESSNWYMELGFDSSKLNFPDEKVAVTQWCEGGYLNDVIEINSDLIQKNVDSSNCKLIISDKKDASPVQYAQLIHTWWSYELWWNQTPRVYAVNSWSGATWSVFSWTWDIKATPAFARWGSNPEDILTIKENGIYNFTYESYAYCDYPIIFAIRAGLWVWWLELWDFKYRWIYWSDTTDFTQIIDQWFPSPESAWVTWWAMAMDNSWFSFTGSYILLVDSAPVSVRFAVKPDTRMHLDPRILEQYKEGWFTARLNLSASEEEIWPQSVITITKLFDYNNLKNYKTI